MVMLAFIAGILFGVLLDRLFGEKIDNLIEKWRDR
jgi:hypothetical protein